MAIITVAEVKTLLGITASTYDTWIATLIPIVQDDLVCYLNNSFPDNNTKYESANISIQSSGPYINDTSNPFTSYGFEAGMDIYVSQTWRNAGIYTISSISSSQIGLSSLDTMLAESSTELYGGNSILITRVNWPTGIKTTVSQIIWFNIKDIKGKDVKSKSLGPSSVTYHSIEGGGYPQHIYSALRKYRRMSNR